VVGWTFDREGRCPLRPEQRLRDEAATNAASFDTGPLAAIAARNAAARAERPVEQWRL
jgi:hypothetical protein